LEPLDGDKTGENLAAAFEHILQQLSVWPRVGHVTTDGGADFLKMLRQLAPLLPGFSFENNGLRCLAHVLNNAIHRMFTAMHCEGFESEEVAMDRLHILPMDTGRRDLLDSADDTTINVAPAQPQPHTEVLDFETVLNKVRSLVCSIRLSDKRRRTLRRHCCHTAVQYHVPQLDRTGRWNSTHDMLEIIADLQCPLRLLCFDDPRLGQCWPTAHEWDMIKRFKEILAQYKEASLFMQSSQEVTITWAFPVLDKIMEDIEKFHSTGRWGDDAIKQALHLAWEALAKYYRVMSQSVYYVCLFLDPQVKSTYMENHWEEEWVAQGEERLQEAWRRYKNLDDAPHSPPRPAVTAGRPIPPNPFRHAVEMGSQQHGPPPDELELYRQMPFMSQDVWESRYQCNPLLWWADTGQVLFPRLALMAKDFFSAQRKTPSPHGFQD
jgi:hypothetical protein